MFSRRRAKKQVRKSDALADRAAVVAEHAAIRAAGAARNASHRAAPVLRRQAHSAAGTLSEAAERAAEMLADTADRLAASETSVSARAKLADRVEALAGTVRPKKKHRIRKLFFLGALVGAATAVVKSRAKWSKKVTGSPAVEPQAITLPQTSGEADIDAAPPVEAKSR